MKKLINFEDIYRARKILDLGETASMQEIKDKYRKLSLKYNPDRHNNSLKKKEYEEKIKEINNSYEILINFHPLKNLIQGLLSCQIFSHISLLPQFLLPVMLLLQL